MLKKSSVAFIAGLTFFTLAACSPKNDDQVPAASATPAVPTPPAAKDAVAATVNGKPISEEQVTMILKQQRGMPDTPETRKMIIDNLAIQLLVADEAMKKGLEKTADVQSELEMAKQSVLAQAYVQDFIKNSEVTDAQLNAEYDKLKAQASSEQYKARHILVKDEKEAQAIIAKLNKNVKQFDEIAKKESLDPGSKAKGGDLGWFDAKSMVPEFSAAVAKLEKGKFTETPVKTQFGYHIIILDDTRPNPSTIPPLDQIKAGLTQQIQQENLRKKLDDMKANAKIEIVAVAVPPAVPTPPATPAPEAAKPTAPAAAESTAKPAPAESKKPAENK